MNFSNKCKTECIIGRVPSSSYKCKTNTMPILMHQMRISTTSVVLITQEGIFNVLHLLWHGLGYLYTVACYDNPGVLKTYSKQYPHRINLFKLTGYINWQHQQTESFVL
jgi:hypothetical protein